MAALLLLLVLLPTEVNKAQGDGIVYGGLVGLGFAVTETVVYIVQISWRLESCPTPPN